MTRDEQQRRLSGSGAGRVTAEFDRGGMIPIHARDSAVPSPTRGDRMTMLLIAIAVGCRKCPIFAVCPVKGVIRRLQEGGRRTGESGF